MPADPIMKIKSLNDPRHAASLTLADDNLAYMQPGTGFVQLNL